MKWFNPAMLSAARSIPSSGAAVQWYETSAEAMPLPDGAVDVVLCQLGLQFVADKQAALREMRRVLVPGGRVLVSAPATIERLFRDAGFHDVAVRT